MAMWQQLGALGFQRNLDDMISGDSCLTHQRLGPLSLLNPELSPSFKREERHLRPTTGGLPSPR
ncbi:hypothetical protein U9M48_015812 [Paspalum notatum var. saurae]|uniref:Uncharacterized protein n=1 Tax=Paspalum notatum var. saurae TaxID=547442 RepID=A0AAQ3T5Q2_PASNO